MKFGAVPLSEAEGAILAHTARDAGGTIRKGTRLDAGHIARLRAAGVGEVIVARPEPGDLGEDDAARRLATAVAGPGTTVEDAFTGRANIFAETAGVLVVDREGADRFNRVDEAVTLATLEAMSPVVAGEMVATVKIIPFAVAERAVGTAAGTAGGSGLLRVQPYRARKVGVVSTLLPGTTEKMLAKTARILAERLAASGSTVIEELRVPHEAAAVSRALEALRATGAELVIVFGASAIVDRADVIPAGIVAAGGRIVHFGMPVDPGNLMLIAERDGTPVLGAPGCARSPRENGFDWVLQRMLADLPVGPGEVTGMGVGGLLMEIKTRPQPRAAPAETPAPRVAALVLAAGQSRRMGKANKLTERVGGKAMARIAAEAALASRAVAVTVVTGHEKERVEAALEGLDVAFVHNPDHAAGLSTSLRAGVAALPQWADAAVVCLADMPGVDAGVIDRLIAAFDPTRGKLIAVPTAGGKRGNPVLWSRRYFDDLGRLKGDVGARHLIGEHADAVVEVEMADAAVLTDIDTPEALARSRRGGDPG